MKTKHFLLFIAFLFVFFTPVHAINCDSYMEKADQYKLENEQTHLWGSVTIEQNSYCIFEYVPKGLEVSPIIILNDCGLIETSNLEKIVFAYYSGDFLRQNGNIIKSKYNFVYNGLSSNAEKYGNKKLTIIAEGIEKTVGAVDICIPLKANIKMCVGETTKTWLFKVPRFGNIPYNVRSWQQLLKDMGDTIFLTDKLQEKNINYQSDLERYYTGMGSMKLLVEEVDNTLGTNYLSVVPYHSYKTIAILN